MWQELADVVGHGNDMHGSRRQVRRHAALAVRYSGELGHFAAYSWSTPC